MSFLQVLDHGEIARRDLALDARFVPCAACPLALTGFALLQPARRAPRRGATSTATGSSAAASRSRGDYRRTAPDLFLPRNSIFSVFSQEIARRGGRLPLPAKLCRACGCRATTTSSSTPTARDRTRSGQADRHLSRAARRWAPTAPDRRAARDRVRDWRSPRHGYGAWRVALHDGARVRRRAAHARRRATADAAIYFFDADVNGERRSYIAAATLAWSFLPRWRAVVTGIGSVTPFAERRFEGMAKLVYQLTTEVRRVVAGDAMRMATHVRRLALVAVVAAALGCARVAGPDTARPREADDIRFAHSTHARARRRVPLLPRGDLRRQEPRGALLAARVEVPRVPQGEEGRGRLRLLPPRSRTPRDLRQGRAQRCACRTPTTSIASRRTARAATTSCPSSCASSRPCRP